MGKGDGWDEGALSRKSRERLGRKIDETCEENRP